ncbi:uncharacterized protein SPPG_01728 [Spizellomyces punctatus DAOM BR117]|uniref:Peptidase M20 dimerisation domain-containing protein n=1 Tax=Spizellomyces punctatus (strain DAOM BR117) TaxID=645134 RepID=A0A0L0HNW9_SPIPD|nr:uncharacterized protein SPPG_01728 [Spizellomyces punctatus DAOM BR117]KND02640.1 hypothetical protein SPPG_01728 [Spizellomyces punctatus DAOM BR117]|eukprot:XP_016610679.1 hypothetical protein SPPG_01728 [Spizellomyces punctatus DAOM BR117]
MSVKDKALLMGGSEALPQPCPHQGRKSPRRNLRRWLWGFIAVMFACHTLPRLVYYNASHDCVQPDTIVPKRRQDITDKNYEGLFKKDAEWRKEASERLAQAVRIKTETFDFLRDVPPPQDGEDVPERKGLEEFRQWLEKAYPQVHQNLSREVVNRYALLYTWKGTDESAKPLVLCSHMDTVPVPESSLDQWTHPPFSGYNDGKYIWGRGSVDTKNTLVGIVEAVETLLRAGFEPQRTVILAFGFDEEISGYQGAQYLAKTLLDRGLKDGVELLVDEGPGIGEDQGATFARVGVAEKGYTDVTISVITPGGHSSIPPAHTGIGILSHLITRLEANPHEAVLSDDNPFLAYLRCEAKFAPDMSQWLRTAIRKINIFRPALVRYLSKDPRTRYMLATSQAVDMIHGGVKLNALPELATAEVNHRIAVHTNVSQLESHLRHLLGTTTEKLGLEFIYTDHLGKNWTKNTHCEKKWTGTVHITTYKGALEPAPISPFENSKAWSLLGGTIRRVSGDNWDLGSKEKVLKANSTSGDQNPVIVAPVLMPANTDTRHYWNLTRNIYRFNPVRGEKAFGVHTVNEHIAIDAFVESVAFYHELIRNFDEL